jgi:hypothetical protein
LARTTQGLHPSRGSWQWLSGQGNCYNNAAVDTSFKTINAEPVWRDTWHNRKQAEMAIFEHTKGF